MSQVEPDSAGRSRRYLSLHNVGLLFCDLNLDNIIQTQHGLKLIGLGGVYRMSGPSGVASGTVD